MIIAGAGGHAKEILGVLVQEDFLDEIFLFDDITYKLPDRLYQKFRILRTLDEAALELKNDPRFILGVGVPKNRKILFEKFVHLQGKPVSMISTQAYIGNYGVVLADGLNIMPQSVITEDVNVGKGSLIHFHASIHHDCSIGEFCEILPGSKILGNVTIGDMCSIGSGATILPKITIGSNVTIGAGAVVTKNVADGKTMVGIPARVRGAVS